MNIALVAGLLWFGLVFALPAMAIAGPCAERVLSAVPDRRAAGWVKAFALLILTGAAAAVLVGVAAVMGAATATAGEATRVVKSLLVKTGAFLALIGWFAPLVATRWLLNTPRERGGDLLVRLSPVPFLAAGLGVLVWFAVQTA